MSRSEPTVEALISTYAREEADRLAASLHSLRAQTRPLDGIVLVVDGPVDADQDEVIERFVSESRIPDVRILRLARNVGLAGALNAGLAECRADLVMRHDSDDICAPDRLALQLACLAAHPDVDVVSSWSEEFSDEVDDRAPRRLKTSPVSHDHVVSALRWRNVITHPTLLVRRAALEAVGGYRGRHGLLEDYDLFVRLALQGSRFHVVPKALVAVRVEPAQRVRRGGLGYALRELRFRAELRRSGFLGRGQFLVSTALYLLFRLASSAARGRLYALVRT